MIRNESVLCMPLTTWDSEFPNTLVQLMHEFSRFNNKILFVDYEFTIKDLVNGSNGGDRVPVKRILGIKPRLRKVKTKYNADIYVLTPPPVLPVNWVKWDNPYRVLLQLNCFLIRKSINDALIKLGISDPILINGYNPFFGLHLAGAFKESLNIYYCYDEIKGDAFYSLHGPSIEKDYIRKVDGVITTSDALHESKCHLHPNCFVVKNGVDLSLFNQVASQPRRQKERPLIGYTGSIDERFDTECMHYLIRNMPEADFLLVGRTPNREAKEQLLHYPNVTFAGSRKPEEVPGFLVDVDVCIIPYIKSTTTRGVYPLKINEYLAAGKPVVMTDFAYISDLDCVVSVADNKEHFLQLVRSHLNSTEQEIRRRIKIASRNSWENKAEELSEAIEAIRVKKFIVQ